MPSIPLMVDLKGRIAVIVGGGKVATKRAFVLAENGALVTIVSPEISNDLHEWVKNGRIDWKQRPFQVQDVNDVYIVVIATNDAHVNDHVYQSAQHVPLINVTSHAERGNLQFPSHISRGKLSIAVSTHGASPKLTSRIKEELAAKYDQTYEPYVEFLYQCRQYIKQSSMSQEKKNDLLLSLLEEDYMAENQQRMMLDWLKQMREGGEE